MHIRVSAYHISHLLAIASVWVVMVSASHARPVPALGDNILTVALAGVVYRDDNQDGICSSNEGMAGVSIVAEGAGAAVGLCAMTPAAGTYRIPLVPGVYRVSFSSPAFPHPFVHGDVTVRADMVTLEHRVPAKWPVPAAPENVDASDGMYDDRVVVSWNAAQYAARYRVVRSVATPVTAMAEPAWSTDVVACTSFTDASVMAGTTYVYWVHAGNTSGWSQSSAADQGCALAQHATCSVHVTSLNPAQGVAISMAPKDLLGLQHGITPFARMYAERRFVSLSAPRIAHSNFFHHWEINLATMRIAPRARLRMEGIMHARAVYLDVPHSTVVKYTARARKDFLIVRDLQPALSNLFAARQWRVGLLDAETHAVVDGPHVLEQRARGALYQYNGTRTKTAVIRCYPSEDVLVYLLWKKLPARVILGAWTDDTAARQAVPSE
jgi:hypothetical protein